jgi:hypothetical protein
MFVIVVTTIKVQLMGIKRRRVHGTVLPLLSQKILLYTFVRSRLDSYLDYVIPPSCRSSEAFLPNRKDPKLMRWWDSDKRKNGNIKHQHSADAH